jgi:hypothetical protein
MEARTPAFAARWTIASIECPSLMLRRNPVLDVSLVEVEVQMLVEVSNALLFN